jgi:hypothetical protein
MGNKFTLEDVLLEGVLEAYHNEVVATEMEDLIIGKKKEYADEADWCLMKVTEWIDAANNRASLAFRYDMEARIEEHFAQEDM